MLESTATLPVGTVSYGLGATAFLLFALLLLFGWRGRLRGGLLLLSVVLSGLWSAFEAMANATGNAHYSVTSEALETFSTVSWLLFLQHLLPLRGGVRSGAPRGHGLLVGGVMLIAFAAVVIQMLSLGDWAIWALPAMLRDASFTLLAVAGLVLVEQVFRNSVGQSRSSMKFLCVALGGWFTFELYLYSTTLLIARPAVELWQARGLIQLIIAPLLALAVARSRQQWSLEPYVSRSVVLHGAALLACSIYLLTMATIGRVIKYHTGEWGGVLQVGFLFATGVFLLLVTLSPRVRSRTRVFLNKHFFAYRYDYRHEWLQVIATMSTTDGMDLRIRVIRVLAQLLESRGGLLWTRERGRGYSCSASWRMEPLELEDPSNLDSLTEFLVESGWVVDLDEYRSDASCYPELALPSELLRISNGWLIVPLLLDQELQGMVLLARPRAPRQLNWEDHDLLKTMGQQVSSYLALIDASKELLEARQFEALNRLTAFLIHDLKNMVAQLSLVVSNAKRHGSRPEFLEDAVATLDNVTRSMNKLVASLRRGEAPSRQDNQPMLVADFIRQTLAKRYDRRPVPEIVAQQGDLRALADPGKLRSALEHLIQNAQEATPETGRITVSLHNTETEVLIDVTDTGSGMDAAFVRERLFKPFDSTKGSGGMGIGAYQARQLVRELGGELSVRSKFGAGTTFTVRLPRLAPGRAVAGGDVVLGNPE